MKQLNKYKANSNITADQVVTAICGFISQITDNPVVISQTNRVSDIVQDHVVVTLLREEPQGYVREKMDLEGVVTHTTNSNLTVQVDCYGVQTDFNNPENNSFLEAATTARNIARMVKTNFACDYFKKQGLDIAPLYATNTKNMNFINDADQYEQRHMFEITVNYNPSVTISQDYFTDIDLKIAVPVDLLPIK